MDDAGHPHDIARLVEDVCSRVEVSVQTDVRRWLQREFAALATEMEGAAVGYTCGLNAVPFVVIRVLSDTASESASGDFASNLAMVCRNSFAILERLIPAVGAEAGAGDATKPDYQRAS